MIYWNKNSTARKERDPIPGIREATAMLSAAALKENFTLLARAAGAAPRRDRARAGE